MLKCGWQACKRIPEADFATAVPDPMATPISAFFNAGASLTPSPVMADISPSPWRYSTILLLCAGSTRENNLQRKSPPLLGEKRIWSANNAQDTSKTFHRKEITLHSNKLLSVPLELTHQTHGLRKIILRREDKQAVNLWLPKFVYIFMSQISKLILLQYLLGLQ